MSDSCVTHPELRAELADLEIRLIRQMHQQEWRTVGAVFVIASLLFAALRYLPPVA